MDVSDWRLSDAQTELLLREGMSPGDASRVRRFLRERDRHLGMASRLLQRHLIASVLGLEYSSITIDRTAHGKPYFAGMRALLQERGEDLRRLRNWNYSVSHHGALTVIASEPVCLCGVDVAQVLAPTAVQAQGGVSAYLRCFHRCFTLREWLTIHAGVSEEDQLRQFAVHWALKEAFIKAVGSGLGYDLQRIDFQLSSDAATDCTDAHIYIDGAADDRWVFKLYTIAEYVICVARGPSQACQPSDMGHVQQCVATAGEEASSAFAPQTEFRAVKLCDIVPAHLASLLSTPSE